MTNQGSKYKEIRKAISILDLPDRATMEEIRSAYRQFVHKWHPDRCRSKTEDCSRMLQEGVWAYRVLISYCNNYRFSFTKEDVHANLRPEERWVEQFGNDPLWGNG